MTKLGELKPYDPIEQNAFRHFVNASMHQGEYPRGGSMGPQAGGGGAYDES